MEFALGLLGLIRLAAALFRVGDVLEEGIALRLSGFGGLIDHVSHHTRDAPSLPSSLPQQSVLTLGDI
jgi:hypothetical protein